MKVMLMYFAKINATTLGNIEISKKLKRYWSKVCKEWN